MSSKTLDDPRDVSLEQKFSLPNSWRAETSDLSTTGMFFAGLIMITRNRFLAWPSLLFGINGLINSHPLRQSEGSGSPMSNISLCLMALVASYIPMFMVSKDFGSTNTFPSSS
ncbi:rba2 protein [Moniliophthora roreri]|uniref:Rba2 protein n=1 Tax=Moniliophthora roreri TaxID=221103 RepID=A0A0W0FF30_MONRR|nr:rba2 protein [Moniliophthora roreri]